MYGFFRWKGLSIIDLEQGNWVVFTCNGDESSVLICTASEIEILGVKQTDLGNFQNWGSMKKKKNTGQQNCKRVHFP